MNTSLHDKGHSPRGKVERHRKSSSTSSSPRVNIENDADNEQEPSPAPDSLPLPTTQSMDEMAFWKTDFIKHPTVDWDSNIKDFVCSHILYKLSATNDFASVIASIGMLMQVSPQYAFTDIGQRLCTMHFLLIHHASTAEIVDLLRIFAVKTSADLSGTAT